MSELMEIYVPGDYVYVRDHSGKLWIYMCQSNGTVILVCEPANPQ